VPGAAQPKPNVRKTLHTSPERRGAVRRRGRRDVIAANIAKLPSVAPASFHVGPTLFMVT